MEGHEQTKTMEVMFNAREIAIAPKNEVDTKAPSVCNSRRALIAFFKFKQHDGADLDMIVMLDHGVSKYNLVRKSAQINSKNVWYH